MDIIFVQHKKNINKNFYYTYESSNESSYRYESLCSYMMSENERSMNTGLYIVKRYEFRVGKQIIKSIFSVDEDSG